MTMRHHWEKVLFHLQRQPAYVPSEVHDKLTAQFERMFYLGALAYMKQQVEIGQLTKEGVVDPNEGKVRLSFLMEEVMHRTEQLSDGAPGWPP